MNCKKLIVLSTIFLGMFAVSTAIAQTQMRRTPMRAAQHVNVSRAGMPSVPTMPRLGNRVFAERNRFSNFDERRFNDHDFDHRFRNRFVFIDTFGFGFPFFYPYPYPYYTYYPYGYGYPYGSGYYSYQGEASDGSLVIQVQTRLAREGYYYGAVDGIMGRRTRAAIRTYERTHNLPVDGVITQQLLGTMRLRY